MKKATHPEEQSRPHAADDTTQPGTKIARILAHLITGVSLNRFEAERIGDHCLPSTIAVLANHYRLEFQRQSERVPNRFGTMTDVTRYSLPESQREHARRVLLALTNKQGKGAQDAN